MQFSKVVGQQPAKNGLLNMWHKGNLPHAILLAGAEGTGGLQMALALAQFILCENKKENDSCGHCPNCSKVSKLEHADLHITFPSIPPKPNTKAMSRYYIAEFRKFLKHHFYASTYDWLQYIEAENKQGNISAEECREIIEKLYLKSYEGGMKLHIIWRPEYLGKEGNILLKLLEEPPNDTVIILVAENTDEILPTILSRMQLVRLGPLSPADIAQTLVEHHHADPRRAAQVANMANGSFGEALHLLKHAENDLFPDVKTLFNAVFVNNGLAIARFAEDWSKKGREQQKNFLHYVIELLRHSIRAKYMPGAEIHLPAEETEFVKKLTNKNIHIETLQKMTESISDTIYYIERNAHAKTQLHALYIRLNYAVQGKGLIA